MLNVEGRIREERPAKKVNAQASANKDHLAFSDFGVVGNDPESSAGTHGKKRLEAKPSESHCFKGKKVVSDADLKERYGKIKRIGKMMTCKAYKAEHDGEWEKPHKAPPGANLTSRERMENIVTKAVHADPTLAEHVNMNADRLDDAVKYVQRAEAAKCVTKRNTEAAHIRGDNEPSVLRAPFAQKTTQEITNDPVKFSKRMLNHPDEPSPKPFGLRRVAYDDRETPFDTKVAKFYPDPPAYGKGRKIWEPQGKKQLHPKIAEHDLDEIAVRQAQARCSSHTEKDFPDFVLGNPPPGRQTGKNSSPEKNRSHFLLGSENYQKQQPELSVTSSRPSTAGGGGKNNAPAESARNTRNGYAHVKNASTKLW